MAIPEILSELAAATTLDKRAVTNLSVLNEAYDYARPSSFSRGLRLELGNIVVVIISGTASIDENGVSIHIGDFRAQVSRVYQNIKALLEKEGATWKDVVRTGCFLRDIERDYAEFNEERTRFFQQEGIELLPASIGIQAILCRPELLVEIEAMAVMVKK
jgi:enamine deaminase RidA (YjgF/YER057c/UK114 family)